GVAHDFNNMLSVILSYSDMLLSDLPLGAPGRPELVQILRAGERASEITRQLLAFSRRQVLQPAILDLNKVIGGMRKMLARLVGEQVELTVIEAADLDPVLVDPGQIQQVIVNLAVNARDAMPEGGALTIRTVNTALDARYATEHPGVEAGPYVSLMVG